MPNPYDPPAAPPLKPVEASVPLCRWIVAAIILLPPVVGAAAIIAYLAYALKVAWIFWDWAPA